MLRELSPHSRIYRVNPRVDTIITFKRPTISTPEMLRWGNLLSKMTRDALNIIENKSKVRYSRNKPNASRMNTTSRESVSKTDERIDKAADHFRTYRDCFYKVFTPAPDQAVEETCVTCGGAHSWYNCPTTDNNQASVCATTGTYNQVAPPNRVSNQMAPPGFAPVQNNGQNRFNQNQGQGNNFNRGNNFHEDHSIPTNPSPKKVVERETKETTDKEQSNFQGSTAQIPPPVTPISIPEPDVPKTLPKTTPISEPDVPKNLPKPNIPYPSRLNQEKFHEKLRFSNNDSSGGNITPTSEPLTSEFILEEIEAYLKDDSILPEINHADCDLEGDICLIGKLLNNDPFQLPQMTQTNPWVSPVHLVYPKKGGITVVANEEKLSNSDTISIRGISKYQINPQDQEKTTFTCPYGTFVYRRMPFCLCNAPGTFQRCMMATFHDMIEKTMEVFMDDFSIFGDNFDSCFSNLEKMQKRCEDTNLVLN
ncbi:hypothetical protein Tco_0047371 [Tanacetum coccineum]